MKINEMYVGQSYTMRRTFSQEEVMAFANLSLDTNPLHTDPAYAAGSRFELALVQYADDPYTSLSWKFDGQAVQAGSVTLTAGKHLVEAHLIYPDGAVEVIRLTIQAE